MYSNCTKNKHQIYWHIVNITNKFYLKSFKENKVVNTNSAIIFQVNNMPERKPLVFIIPQEGEFRELFYLHSPLNPIHMGVRVLYQA